MTPAAPAIPFLVLLTACTLDQGFGTWNDFTGGDTPIIEVKPPILDFGALHAGEEVTQTFHVRNVGPDNSLLEVSEITLGGAAGFTILTPAEELSFSLPGGGATTHIDVLFTPHGALDRSAEAIVASNDPELKRARVQLAGEGLVPELEIDPDPLGFGMTYVGCDKDHDITLTNVGTDDLILSDITHTGGSFFLTDSNVLPLTLAPDESTLVNVMFAPFEEGAEVGELAVTSNEPIGTRVSQHTGEGVYVGKYEEEFVVPVNPPADIIFFVDQSGSMDDDSRALGTNFSDFIAELSVYTSDWHIIVTNGDDGCKDTTVLTSATPDYEGQFVDFVSRGGNGDYTEAGLIVTTRAIEATDPGECNENFLREGAMLHVIMVSDEPEQSPRSWDTYVDQAIAKKGDPSLVKFSAVAGDAPDGCESGANSADYGSGYYEAVNATGGEWLSICSNWSTSVEALATASVDMFAFELSRLPVVDTIAVTVNGAARAAGWSYQSATNSVVFIADRPQEGDVVVVTYAILGECD